VHGKNRKTKNLQGTENPCLELRIIPKNPLFFVSYWGFKKVALALFLGVFSSFQARLVTIGGANFFRIY
jgi:hypothetical protein